MAADSDDAGKPGAASPYRAAGQVRLTKDVRAEYAPSWAPDGRSLVFKSVGTGSLDIESVNRDGGGARSLSQSPQLQEFPRFTPDGSRIAFQSTRDVRYELYVMQAGGSSATRLTRNKGGNFALSWSPEGTGLSFQSSVPAAGSST